MSELATLARPYAEAVFKRAKESGNSQEWSDNLAFLSAIMQDESLAVIVNNPRVEEDRLTALLQEICQDQVTGEANNFLSLAVPFDSSTISLARFCARFTISADCCFASLKTLAAFLAARSISSWPFSAAANLRVYWMR
jgi:hypothetical protein